MHCELEKSNMDSLASRLRQLRETHTRPIKSMAITSELIGLEKSTLAKFERGERLPRADTLRMIADYYEVSVDYILGRTDKKR